MTNKHFSPSIGEFATQERTELLARIEDQAREIDVLKINLASAKARSERRVADIKLLVERHANELAALKSQPSGVVLPEPFEMRPFQTVDQGSTNYKAGFNAALRKVRENLNSPPVSDGVVDERAIDAMSRFVETVRECYQLASSYSGCLDGVDERGGDDHEDPICAVFHRLYYAMFDGDKALELARAALTARPDHSAHPDDVAVDRFAAAMKTKMAKSRDKGRHGWQNATAPHLSSLLYEHMYKGDPLDVANLAMMLHQNKQAIELPDDARRRPDHSAQSLNMVPDVIRDQHRKAMKLLREVRCWIIPKGNISMSIIERVSAFLDSAAPAPGKQEGE